VNSRPSFKLHMALLSIEDELTENINVVINTAYFSETDLAALRAAIHARGWSSRVLYGDSS
jgi:hypothetical protein